MKYSVLLLATSVTLATPSLASRDSDFNMPTAEALQVFHKFNECEVRLHPKESADVVLSNETNEQLARRYPSLLSPDCLDYGSLKIPGGEYVKYGLAEALIRREYAKGLPPDITQAAPLAHPEVKDSEYQPKPGKTPTAKELADLEAKRTTAVTIRVLSIYGECVARLYPAAALRLILSTPASSDETQAFAALHDTLASCLPPGKTVEFGKPMLRGAIALNLYRLAKAPRIFATATTK